MNRPRLLDLFCCAGGAAWGYHRAGFDVVGVDIAPQPNYPFEFVQGDALAYLMEYGHDFDAIHASPPCQAFTAMRHMPDARRHPDFIGPTRQLLGAMGIPHVIENVVGAPIRNPTTLCGTMFGLGVDGFELQRHRLFESNVPIEPPAPCRHALPVIGVYGGHVRCRSKWRNGGRDFPGLDRKQLAMTALGIEHPMTMGELSEAIPPAYAEHLGAQLLAALLDRST